LSIAAEELRLAEANRSRTGAPGSPQRTPDFLLSSLALTTFMDDLHAAFLNESRTRVCLWSPVQEIRIPGPIMICFDCFSWPCVGFAGQHDKKLWWASPLFFGPRTLRRTWGTRPAPSGPGYDTDSSELSSSRRYARGAKSLIESYRLLLRAGCPSCRGQEWYGCCPTGIPPLRPDRSAAARVGWRGHSAQDCSSDSRADCS
jgi:hypothetical protein